jgi:dTDP-4-amino-4,6-dideoxygalactose transaminase
MSTFAQRKQLNANGFCEYLETAQATNQFTNYGSAVRTLEERARTMLQINDNKAIIATSSGASAYQAILLGMYAKHNRELFVFSQDFTFPCNFQGASLATPLDIDNNQQIDLTHATTKNAIVVVTNCFGHLQNLHAIADYTSLYQQFLVLDNAATPYSFINNTNSCNLGVASYISLHHTKPIGFGEGGLAIIDKEYEIYVRAACNFGIVDGKASKFGSNFKMSELSAAGILQWWDQFDIDELAESYLTTYWSKSQRYAAAKIKLFSNYSDDDRFFPNCLPLIHSSNTPISVYPLEDAKKYYKPMFGLTKSQTLYENIVCLPLSS